MPTMLTTTFECLLRTPLIYRSCQAALAGWLLAASAGAGYGQITNATATLIGLDASNAVRTADARWFGVNSGDYDTDFNIQDTVPELNHAGLQTLRFPGGSEADEYHWYNNVTNNNNSYQGNNSVTSFAAVATNIGAAVIITANYGSGTPAEAAGWVAFANVTNQWAFKYWEIGNECYGTYETDDHANPHDPYTYATNFPLYLQQMKAFDPTIKVGVVLDNGLDPTADSNGYTAHPATNLVTGAVLYGWTPVVLSTLRQLGIEPDFGILHRYAEYPPSIPDSDSFLLQTATNWSGQAQGLRQMITQYFGPSGSNMELIVTEDNCDPSVPEPKQSVSLVDGLYYADSLGQLAQTEFNALVWWQWRDGGPPETGGNMSTNLYGWRQYGAFGMMWYENLGLLLTNRFPTYFSAELVSHFIRGGDTVLQASTGNPLVAAYAALRTNGALTVMAINKSPITNYPIAISLTNYAAFSTATLYSYGMPQDDAAAAANNACDIAQTNIVGGGTNFNYALAPYSITVFNFAPLITNAVTPAFSGLASHTVAYGATVALTGTVGTPGAYPPIGTAITATIAGVPQTAYVSDATGDFSIYYNTANLPGMAGTYPITYASAVANGFNAAADASTALTITLSSAEPAPGITNWVGIFNSSADTAVWVNAEGLGAASFLAGDAPPGGPSTGCLLFQAPYSPTNATWQGIQNESLNLNVSNYTAFEMDVKVEGPVDTYRDINSLQPIMQTGADLDWIASTVQPELVRQTTNGGWQHLAIPAASFDGGSIANWADIQRLLLTVYDGSYTNLQTMAIGFDNLKFSGPGVTPVFSGLTSHTVAYGAGSVTLTGKVSANGAYPPGGTVVFVTIGGSLQATTIYDATGDFSINYNTTALPASATPYTVTYTSASGNGFNAATDASTKLTVTAPTQIGGIQQRGNLLIFSYPTVSGKSYQLLCTTNLGAGVWLPVGSAVPGTGAPVWTTNSIATSTQQFFRLSITP
jgi:hypothetical protein